jgi:DNA-binding NarL/FixJ family response regulator
MKILIVDDHALVRRGMNYVVKEGFPDAEVTEAEGAAAALECFRAGTAFDLALVDVRMPDLDGLELLRAVKAEWPDVPIIMLSTYENAPYVKRALADGASGYLLKDATPEDLAQAIKVAMSGSGNVLSPRVIQNLFEDQESSSNGASGGRRNEYSLTQRHLGSAVRGPFEPRDRPGPLPVREDGEGAPCRHLPQTRCHEPDAGRDDGRADGRGADARCARQRVTRSCGWVAPTATRPRSRGRTGSVSARVAPDTCSPPARRGSRRAS